MNALLCALTPLIGAVLLLVPMLRGRAAGAVLLISAATSTVLSLSVAIGREPKSSEYYLDHYFVVDGSSVLFLVLINIIFFGITFYTLHRFWSAKEAQADDAKMTAFVARSLLFFATAELSVLSNHLIAMWIFLELGTLALAPLIFFNRGEMAERASWKYLMFSVIGLGFNFLGLMCIARGMGGSHGAHEADLSHTLTFFVDELLQVPSLGESPWWKLGLALMVFGLGTKLGLAPMYTWCPDAYDEAPQSITTTLASVQFNCVILALFREIGVLRSFDPNLVSTELVVMGVASIGIAALHIITADNFQRLIAYASINHAGTIALGLAVAHNVNAAYGVVLYVVSNAFVKAVLFMTCGNMEAHFGTKKISSLRGVIRVMPFSGWAFMLGVFALLGFAPFGSFVGEVIMLSNMAEGGYLLVFFFVCIVLTLVLIACGRSLFPMIWGDASDEGVRHHDPVMSNIGSAIFIGILVSLGIYTPAAVTDLLQEVAVTLVADERNPDINPNVHKNTQAIGSNGDAAIEGKQDNTSGPDVAP